jgi:hypothetical protein
MKMMYVGSVIVAATVLLFAGTITMASAAAEGPQKGKKSTKAYTPVSKSGVGVESIRASGADQVAKSQSCSTATPKIKNITPDEGRAGDRVKITGVNFGKPGCVSGVSFGPGSPAKFTQQDDKTVTATVPDGHKGLEMLTLTGFTGEDSKVFVRK